MAATNDGQSHLNLPFRGFLNRAQMFFFRENTQIFQKSFAKITYTEKQQNISANDLHLDVENKLLFNNKNWLVVEPPIWKIWVKLGIFPNFRDENQKYLSCHHLEKVWTLGVFFPWIWVMLISSLQRGEKNHPSDEVQLHFPAVFFFGALSKSFEILKKHGKMTVIFEQIGYQTWCHLDKV